MAPGGRSFLQCGKKRTNCHNNDVENRNRSAERGACCAGLRQREERSAKREERRTEGREKSTPVGVLIFVCYGSMGNADISSTARMLPIKVNSMVVMAMGG